MTVASSTSRIEYSTTAGLLTYAYPFRIYAEGELEVHLGSSLRALNVHYTVTGVGNVGGGNVVLSADPGNGALLTIERIMPLTQGHDYVENDNFPADSHELALDRLTMITQMLYERDRKRPHFLKGSATKDWQFPDPSQYVSSVGTPLYVRMNAGHAALEAVAHAADITGVLDDVIPSSGLGAFPLAGTPGRLRRATDDARGIWMDQGTQWFSTTGRTFNVREFGAVGDGATNDTAAFAAAVAALNAGGSLYIPGGSYIVRSELALPSNCMVYGDGSESEIYWDTPILSTVTGAPFRIVNKSNVTIRDLAIRSTNTTAAFAADKEQNKPIFMENSNRCRVLHCLITDYWGNGGAYLGPISSGAATPGCEDCIVAYCHFERAGVYGPVVVAGSRNKFIGNACDDCSIGIEQNSDANPMVANIIAYNTLRSTLAADDAEHKPQIACSANGALAYGNVFHGNVLYGARVAGNHINQMVFTNNLSFGYTSADPDNPPIFLQDTDNCVIEGNIIQAAGYTAVLANGTGAFILYGDTDSKVAHNTVRAAGGHGFAFRDCTRTKILHNSALFNGGSGIQVYLNCDDLTIEGNDLIDNNPSNSATIWGLDVTGDSDPANDIIRPMIRGNRIISPASDKGGIPLRINWTVGAVVHHNMFSPRQGTAAFAATNNTALTMGDNKYGDDAKYGSFTMPAAATYALSNDNVHTPVHLLLIPTNASAAALMAGASALYVQGLSAWSGVTLATADGLVAAGTEQFIYILFN